MAKENKKKQVDDDLLDLSLKMVAAVLVVVFVGFFFWWRGDIKNLGEIGDFFGGMLNPIVAFAALLWLMVGVRMQRRELAAAKAAMESNLEISALVALINVLNEEIKFTDLEIEQFIKAGSPSQYDSLRSSELDDKRLRLILEKNELTQKLRQIRNGVIRTESDK